MTNPLNSDFSYIQPKNIIPPRQDIQNPDAIRKPFNLESPEKTNKSKEDVKKSNDDEKDKEEKDKKKKKHFWE